MKSIYCLALVCFFSGFVFQSCKKDKIEPNNNQNPNPNPNPSTLARVEGFVRAANGITPIGGADVYTDAAHSTKSLPNGFFALDVPEGQQTIHISTGDGNLFKSSFTINAVGGDTVELPIDSTSLGLVGRLAYIPGQYDKIEAIVHDSLGYAITMLSIWNLSQPGYLDTFDAVFVNCGAEDGVLQGNEYNLLAGYVYNGGSLYVSDFAVSYLLGHYNSGTPCFRQDGFIDDSYLCTMKYGPATTLPYAQVIDPSFQAALGTSSINIVYDLPNWEKIENYNSSFWNVIVSDPQFGPLMLRNTSFSTNGGKIYFTTFHNDPNGGIGNDMENMLQYVILDL